ncbi:hypothetical protein GQ457_12G003030 [Hibiscus cannabinus]
MVNQTESIKTLQEATARHGKFLSSLQVFAEEHKRVNVQTQQLLQDVVHQVATILSQLGLKFIITPEYGRMEKIKTICFFVGKKKKRDPIHRADPIRLRKGRLILICDCKCCLGFLKHQGIAAF